MSRTCSRRTAATRVSPARTPPCRPTGLRGQLPVHQRPHPADRDRAARGAGGGAPDHHHRGRRGARTRSASHAIRTASTGRPRRAEELETKYGVLTAMYLPGERTADAPAVYPDMTLVNTFPIVLDRYFDAGIPLLPDRSYTSASWRRPYDLTDITALPHRAPDATPGTVASARSRGHGASSKGDHRDRRRARRGPYGSRRPPGRRDCVRSRSIRCCWPPIRSCSCSPRTCPRSPSARPSSPSCAPSRSPAPSPSWPGCCCATSAVARSSRRRMVVVWFTYGHVAGPRRAHGGHRATSSWTLSLAFIVVVTLGAIFLRPSGIARLTTAVNVVALVLVAHDPRQHRALRGVPQHRRRPPAAGRRRARRDRPPRPAPGTSTSWSSTATAATSRWTTSRTPTTTCRPGSSRRGFTVANDAHANYGRTTHVARGDPQHDLSRRRRAASWVRTPTTRPCQRDAPGPQGRPVPRRTTATGTSTSATGSRPPRPSASRTRTRC